VNVIGSRLRPLDWEAITHGRFLYTADLHRPDALHGVIIRSPHPHARVLQIDVGAALSVPGVRAVLTTEDFSAGIRYIHEGAADRPPLADGVVRFVGQEVAAVAAETEEAARAGAQAVSVRYERLPAVFDLDAAERARKGGLHPRKSGRTNVSAWLRRDWGDHRKGIAACTHSVEGLFKYPAQCHVCMEVSAVIAEWREDEARLHLWTATGAPYYVVKEVSHVMGLERGQVVCHEIGVGGSFGARTKVADYEAIAGALSRKAGRPVRLVLSRDEEFATTKSRHAFESTMRLHGGRGRLRAIEADLRVDNGAYNHSGVSVTSAALKGLGMLYEPDGALLSARLIDTAKRPGGQFRGYGTTQSSFALECLMDELAGASGEDPVAFRRANANPSGSTTLVGAHLGSSRLAECLDAAAAGIGHRLIKFPDEGVGVAAAVHVSGSFAEPGAERSDAALDLHVDGSVTLRFGGADAGTGQKTILAQIGFCRWTASARPSTWAHGALAAPTTPVMRRARQAKQPRRGCVRRAWRGASNRLARSSHAHVQPLADRSPSCPPT